MKKAVTFVLCLLLSNLAQATNVRGYYRKNGTYVAPHTRSAPDSYKYNNFGSANKAEKQSGYNNPYARDKDHDGVPNYLDHDDNNNGISDENE